MLECAIHLHRERCIVEPVRNILKLLLQLGVSVALVDVTQRLVAHPLNHVAMKRDGLDNPFTAADGYEVRAVEMLYVQSQHRVHGPDEPVRMQNLAPAKTRPVGTGEP